MNDKNRFFCLDNIYSLLLGLLFFSLLMFIVLEEKDVVLNKGYLCIILMSFIYLFTKVVFSFSPQKTSFVILIIIIIACLIESLLGVLQLFGCSLLKSHETFFRVTGSFVNPGPYGGFLAICVSILVSYCIHNSHSENNAYVGVLLYRIACFVSIISLIVIPASQSRSAMVALVFNLLLLFYFDNNIKKQKTQIKRHHIILFTICLLLSGIAAYYIKKPSADGRMFTNKISIQAMCANGWKGVGLGNYGGLYGVIQADYFKKQIEELGSDALDWRVIDEHDRMTADCPDNAYNEYLQIGVELGPFIMLLFVAIIVLAIIISFKNNTIWCYGLTAFAVFAFFSYPLHVIQFQILFPILLAVCVGKERNKEKEKWVMKISVLMMSTMITILIIRKQDICQINKAEKIWGQIGRLYGLSYYERVVDNSSRICDYKKHDQQFLFLYGQSLNKIGYYESSDSILKMGSLISNDPMFWNVMGNNSMELGDYREAEERYKHAFYMVPNRLYPLVLLAKLYYNEGDTVRFLKMSDVVEHFVPKVESVRTENLRAEIRELKNSYITEIEGNNEE